jgi:hypothetical protein
MSAAAKIRGALVAALVAFACALLTPAIDHAGAAPNNGGGTKVTCPGGALPDGEPGDVNTVNTYTYVNGKLIAKTTVSLICGNDGFWHTVAALTVPPGQPFPVLSRPGLTLVR